MQAALKERWNDEQEQRTALLASVAVSAAAMLVSANAMAADLTPAAPAPTAEEAIAAASPWMLRVRGLGVITNDSGSVDGVPGRAFPIRIR